VKSWAGSDSHAAERWVDGLGWDDTLVFGMLRDEWRGAPAGLTIDRQGVPNGARGT
jgi:hypothetical protein